MQRRAFACGLLGVLGCGGHAHEPVLARTAGPPDASAHPLGSAADPVPGPGSGSAAPPREGAEGDEPRARLRIGAPVVRGSYDAAAIRAELVHHARELTACYAEPLAEQPDLKGTVTATFFVTATGHVERVTAAGVSPAVARCMASELGALALPATSGAPVDVSLAIECLAAP